MQGCQPLACRPWDADLRDADPGADPDAASGGQPPTPTPSAELRDANLGTPYSGRRPGAYLRDADSGAPTSAPDLRDATWGCAGAPTSGTPGPPGRRPRGRSTPAADLRGANLWGAYPTLTSGTPTSGAPTLRGADLRALTPGPPR